MQTEEECGKKNPEGFTEELRRCLHEMLGGAYQTEVSLVRKNNDVRKQVLFVRQENSDCVPCFYMDELYASYCEGENEPGLAEHITDIVRNECEAVKKQAKQYLEDEWIKEHLFLRLIKTEENRSWLEEGVYVEYLDLAAVFYVVTEESEDGVKSYQLPKHVWETLELGTAEEYFPKVLENTRRLFPERVFGLEAAPFGYLLYEESVEALLNGTQKLYPNRLYVVTNHRKVNGAGAVLYPELLKRFGEGFGGDFYVIPSSVHEVLLLKDTEAEDTERLNAAVREVNEQKVAPEEVLSDHVYHYSAEAGLLRSCGVGQE